MSAAAANSPRQEPELGLPEADTRTGPARMVGAKSDLAEEARRARKIQREAEAAASTEKTAQQEGIPQPESQKNAGSEADVFGFPRQPVTPEMNQRCLDAIATEFAEKGGLFSRNKKTDLLLTQFLKDLALVTEQPLLVRSADNEYLLSKDLIQAQNEKLTAKSAFEMAVLALNNKALLKDGVELQGNLRDRYILSLAANLLDAGNGVFKITNPIDMAAVPDDMKAEFAAIEKEFQSFLKTLEPGYAPEGEPAAKTGETADAESQAQAQPETQAGPESAPTNEETAAPQATAPAAAAPEPEPSAETTAPVEDADPLARIKEEADAAVDVAHHAARDAQLRMVVRDVAEGKVRIDDGYPTLTEVVDGADGKSATDLVAESKPVFVVTAPDGDAPHIDKPHYKYVGIDRLKPADPKPN